LGTSFGRGGATTFQQDLQNSDCIVIEGSNMAECHPVGFRWVMKAKERGATIIHVDPRFTRTSAVADIHVPLRAGSDIAFLGGIIRYILENERYFREYVVHYTNAAAILNKDYGEAGDDGVFAGWDPEKSEYDQTKWMYEGVEPGAAAGARESSSGSGKQQKKPIQAEHTDASLQHPRCVFQVLRRHYARYTPEMVERTCGVPARLLIKVAEALCRNSGRERNVRLLLCRRLDAAHHRRAIHSDSLHHSTAARQYGQAGWGNHGSSRPCIHSGLYRYPNSVQHPSRLSADAACAARQGLPNVQRTERSTLRLVG